MDISMKKLFLAGIGSLAVTYEKAEGMVDELVKKGALAVAEGKELNEELKRNLREKKEGEKPLTSERLREIVSELQYASKKDIEELKARIEELEKK